ncbi:MAG: hypothetical protein GKR95_21300 [Gammaproteobacteria bacterium]|nr:hypothetical protein [Gammaproteobacteria bacterium]
MKKLRIGFLLQGTRCPTWQHEIRQRIEKETNLEICLIAFNGETQQGEASVQNTNAGTASSVFSKLVRPFRLFASVINPLAYGIPHLYQRFDEKYNAESKALWRSHNIEDHPGALKTVLHPIRKGFCHYFSDQDLQTINECNLDVLIRFGFSIIRGDIHKTARHGVWSFHHGDNRFYRGGPPGVWELIKGKPEISVTLQQLNDVLDCGRTIARSTHRCALYSVINNKHTIYKSCGDLLLQKLKQTQSQGFASIQATAVFNEEISETIILKSPRNFQFIPLIINSIKTTLASDGHVTKKYSGFLRRKLPIAHSTDLKRRHLPFRPKIVFVPTPFSPARMANSMFFLKN